MDDRIVYCSKCEHPNLFPHKYPDDTKCKNCPHVFSCTTDGTTVRSINLVYDWLCPKCNVYIFQSKERCKKCDSRKHDWKCDCGYINFATRRYCGKCKMDRRDRFRETKIRA